MRIIGGESRGRRLAPLQGLQIRPTADRVKEAVFNLIGWEITGAHVLDLFAGTGGLGIETLSRGAGECFFIDHSLQALKQIQKNLTLCGYEKRGRVIRHDLQKGLPRECLEMKHSFDLVLLDPPYQQDLIRPVLTEIVQRGILSATALVMAESSKRDLLPEQIGYLRMIKNKIYGDTQITLYQHEVHP